MIVIIISITIIIFLASLIIKSFKYYSVYNNVDFVKYNKYLLKWSQFDKILVFFVYNFIIFNINMFKLKKIIKIFIIICTNTRLIIHITKKE